MRLVNLSYRTAGRLSRPASAIATTARWVALGLFLLNAAPSPGQWLTQTNTLKAGWNAVFLHVDPAHTTLDELVGSDPANPIAEIWFWRPNLPAGQFIESPQVPSGNGSQWITWIRGNAAASSLQRLAGNGAYLVRVGSQSPAYNWLVKGRPVPPTYRWTLTGLNFLGFPTPPNPSPTFESFLLPAPELQQNGEIYRYQGGELGATNPLRVVAFRTTPVRRDQAYWVRAGETYNQYFGPILLSQVGATGIRFGDAVSQTSFRLRNTANTTVSVTLRQVNSEPVPAGQTAIAGPPPLLLRGPINTTNLTFGYSILGSSPTSWTLAPAGQTGSEVEVVLGLNRSQMSAPPGALFAGILRFTDSLGLAQIDVSVSATKESTAGLWVGQASVRQVSHYLKPYARATSDAELAALLSRLQLAQGANGYRYQRDPGTGRVLVFAGPDNRTGSYLLEGPIKTDSGTVASPFPLRLILHHDGSSARLLQQVFHGLGAGSNTVLATRESLLLPEAIASARRISSVHFPTSAGQVSWACSGSLAPGGTLSATVPVAHDDQSSNPFLHTYHPDHDNLDALFQTAQPRGVESYEVLRQITLTVAAPANDFSSLTRGSQDLAGSYAEVVTFNARGQSARQYTVNGTFTLKRLSDIATLTSN